MVLARLCGKKQKQLNHIARSIYEQRCPLQENCNSWFNCSTAEQGILRNRCKHIACCNVPNPCCAYPVCWTPVHLAPRRCPLIVRNDRIMCETEAAFLSPNFLILSSNATLDMGVFRRQVMRPTESYHSSHTAFCFPIVSLRTDLTQTA